ncbi:MAG: DNA alkylation repair protein [Oscillochloris sp.]|nr:DNA alkylation repair protein [Oscillochloris sp.]
MAASRRTGATQRSAIAPETLTELNAGRLETATLAEGLAIDFAQLLHAVAPEASAEALDMHGGVTQRMAESGRLLLAHYGSSGIARFATHNADTVRGWAAYMIAAMPDISLDQRLMLIRPLADDPHFAVREWAWLALRPHLAADIGAAIDKLVAWTTDSAPNLRRFAVESTRPRGVWCVHIGTLKQQPHLGLPLLTPLRADPSRYVQDSVANWLNDAAKSQPAWVRSLCDAWQATSDAAATKRICARALRSLK